MARSSLFGKHGQQRGHLEVSSRTNEQPRTEKYDKRTNESSYNRQGCLPVHYPLQRGSLIHLQRAPEHLCCCLLYSYMAGPLHMALDVVAAGWDPA